ncbi:NAD(P)-dependent oxidoreductase [Puerhibacterium sp. TATVAM-FAB25]|uniref:NAD(P)-dependent oxidoreductase n=1 Tax=Puerhibacterium sp. TATVAM-FAB25 TaxID=3093699 RepID=UPI003978621F
MTDVALLGTGRMGHELAVHLLRAGHRVTAWNRTPAGADRTVDAGAERAATAREATAGRPVVMTVLFGPDAVQETVLDGDVLDPGTVWLDVTTVGPEDAARYARWAAAHGVRYVHGPVVGTLGPARAGKLGVYLGGEEAAVQEVLPLARLWADPERLRVVPRPQDAAVGKLLANLALGVSVQGLVEALRLARSQGTAPADALAMLGSTGLGFIAGMKRDVILDGTFEDTQFSVDLLAKDARLMLAAAGTSLPAVEALLGTLEFAQAAGRGDHDIAAAVVPELPADD